MLQEQQARLARQRARSGSMPPGATPRSRVVPALRTVASAELARQASAAAETGRGTSGIAAKALSTSSEPAVSLKGAKAGRELLPAVAAPTSSTQAAKMSPAGTEQAAATGSAAQLHLNGNGALHSRTAYAHAVDPVQESPSDSLKQVGQLRRKHEPIADRAAQAAQAKESLIQAVPEMPDRRASLGRPDAQKGVNILPPSMQIKGAPHNSHEEVYSHAGESTNDDVSEADLEALLGQLVNRAEHI